MSVRLVVSYPAIVIPPSPGMSLSDETTWPIALSELNLGYYLADDLVASGVFGGEVSANMAHGDFVISITFWTPRSLTAELRAQLLDDVRAQMMDGIGENGFQVLVNNEEWDFQVTDQEAYTIEEREDPHSIPEPPTIALAVKREDTDQVAEALRKYPGSINGLCQEFAALHYAIWRHRFDFVTMLLEANADPNIQDLYKRTPLIACAADRELSDEIACQMARALLERGADPSLRDFMNSDAEEHAQIKNKTQLVKMLQQARPQ